MKEDWDYLIVLDACRYDVFKEIVDKKANYVISGGSCTQEWLEWNFKQKYNDVIYIAGNPHFSSLHLKKTLGFNPFYDVNEVWNYGWDEAINTVPPNQVTQATIDTLNNYPDKRMIIHYNQPHHPFLKDKEILEMDDGSWNTLKGGLWGGTKKTIWDFVKNGEISVNRVKKAYRENLKIVMIEVKKLEKILQGKIILTSDHGNFFGKYGIYGHIPNFRAEELVKVPWVILKDRHTQFNNSTRASRELTKFTCARAKFREKF